MKTNEQPLISVIIPVINEEKVIESTLRPLNSIDHFFGEIIVVDGGSTDRTLEVVKRYNASIVKSNKGRAIQMNTGAKMAKGRILLFLHADTQFNILALEALYQLAMKNKPVWGRFNISFTNTGWLFKVISTMINLRSAITGIASGDQAIFVSKNLFYDIGQFPSISLMEDIALSKKLKSVTRPLCRLPLIKTSSRRWEQRGTLQTILLMWRLRLSYYFGADPDKLAAKYL